MVRNLPAQIPDLHPESQTTENKICLLFEATKFWGEKRKCQVTQSSLTLCDPMDCSLPGFSVHGDSSGMYVFLYGCSLLVTNLLLRDTSI